MQSQASIVGGAIIGILALFMITVVTIVAVSSTKSEAPTEPTQCEVGHVNPDGSVTITEGSAGKYGYTIYATASGVPLVLGDCN